MNKNPNHVKHPTKKAVNARKRAEAEERAFARSKLSPKKQLDILASRPGDSKRERTRLLAA